MLLNSYLIFNSYFIIVVLLQIFIVIRLHQVGSNRGKGKKIVASHSVCVLNNAKEELYLSDFS